LSKNQGYHIFRGLGGFSPNLEKKLLYSPCPLTLWMEIPFVPPIEYQSSTPAEKLRVEISGSYMKIK